KTNSSGRFNGLPSVRDAEEKFEFKENPATAGAGLMLAAVPATKVSGTDTSQQVDAASAYVTFIDKETDKPIGTYLVSHLLNDQKIDVNGTPYHIALRYKRIHKPVAIYLKTVSKDDYTGTDIPRNYSSEILLSDPSTGIVNQPVKIWMNNPMRHNGETYYQSNYSEAVGPDGKLARQTTFQIVTNMGWMIPYVGCMLVATGLLAHFSFTLVRFLRREIGQPTTSPAGKDIAVTPEIMDAASLSRKKNLAVIIGPLIAIAIGILSVVFAAIPRSTAEGEAQITEFARLPIIYEGRVKPFDTLALNSLQVISEKTTFRDRSTITIKAGEESASFEIAAVRDNYYDGAQVVTITASASGFQSASAVLEVTDKGSSEKSGNGSAEPDVEGDSDLPALALDLAGTVVAEGQNITATVKRSGNTSNKLLVNLKSSDTSQAALPKGKRGSANRWLIDLISHNDRSLDHKVFR
ncbi:MAG: cytochrome c biogenesis protein ResB, partial [Planctomycetales bacterium]